MLFLFASVWLAFAGAILDLVASLALSRGESLSTGTNLALTIAREIAYSLSFGLRFLWFWLFVGSPLPVASTQPASTHIHSGSWQRWGIFGHLLRWMVLLAVFAIVSLQIVYRVYTPLNSGGPVYDAEATLQIVLSFVFILKLFMNIYLVALDFPKEPLWSRNLLRYFPILMALLVNFGIGLGNLLQCKSRTVSFIKQPSHVVSSHIFRNRSWPFPAGHRTLYPHPIHAYIDIQPLMRHIGQSHTR